MKEHLKRMRVIHGTLCSGVLLALVVIGNLSNLANFPVFSSDELYFLLALFVIPVIGQFVFVTLLKKVSSKLPLEEKMPVYQTAQIIRLACLEGCLFAIMIILPQFILISFFLLGWMIYLWPTQVRIEKELEKYNC
jgi:hypothetical protein